MFASHSSGANQSVTSSQGPRTSQVRLLPMASAPTRPGRRPAGALQVRIRQGLQVCIHVRTWGAEGQRRFLQEQSDYVRGAASGIKSTQDTKRVAHDIHSAADGSDDRDNVVPFALDCVGVGVSAVTPATPLHRLYAIALLLRWLRV
jgi:hypothetical protein